MTQPEALESARKRWGAKRRIVVNGDLFQVGYWEGSEFVVMGQGTSWGTAFGYADMNQVTR